MFCLETEQSPMVFTGIIIAPFRLSHLAPLKHFLITMTSIQKNKMKNSLTRKKGLPRKAPTQPEQELTIMVLGADRVPSSLRVRP